MNTEQKKLQAMIPEDLHTWLKMEAIHQKTTMAELAAKILTEYKDREPDGEFCSCADEECKGDHR